MDSKYDDLKQLYEEEKDKNKGDNRDKYKVSKFVCIFYFSYIASLDEGFKL